MSAAMAQAQIAFEIVSAGGVSLKIDHEELTVNRMQDTGVP